MAFVRVVGAGHADRLCDDIARGIVLEYHARDPHARLDIRVSGGRSAVFVSGTVASTADFDVASLVKRVLAQVNPAYDIEPFIALDTTSRLNRVTVGSIEPVEVIGYAVAGTQSNWPREAECVRSLLTHIETTRSTNPDWFWLGPDISVACASTRTRVDILVDVEHVDAFSVEQVRTQLTTELTPLLPAGAKLHVNRAGAMTAGGLFGRVGSSGLMSTYGWTGSLIPASVSGIGKEDGHPLNAGARTLRMQAQRLVQEGRGKAVLARAIWFPDETHPAQVRIRNERGEDMSIYVPPETDSVTMPRV